MCKCSWQEPWGHPLEFFRSKFSLSSWLPRVYFSENQTTIIFRDRIEVCRWPWSRIAQSRKSARYAALQQQVLMKRNICAEASLHSMLLRNSSSTRCSTWRRKYSNFCGLHVLKRNNSNRRYEAWPCQTRSPRHSNRGALNYVPQRRPRCVQRLSEESNDGFKRTPHNTLGDPLDFHLLRNVAKTPLLLVVCILSHGQFVESVSDIHWEAA